MSSSGDSGPGTREVAYRLFAAEFDDCSLSYAESDDERAPNYVVTPTGLRVNRLFAVGVLTETEAVNDETLRGRIVDPTGAFVTYAGQYQPEAQAFLDRTTPPAFVAITGKARTFEPEDSDRVFTSVRPESLSEVEASTRDRWVVSAAESTLRRIAICVAALESPLSGEALGRALADAGIDDSLAAGIPRAIEHYGTTTAYLDALRQLAVDALEVVADEREEVRSFDVAPDVDGEASVGPLPPVDVDLSPLATDPQPTDSEPTADATTQTEEPADTASDDAEPATAVSTDTESADSSESATSESTDSTKATDTADTEPPAETVDESTPGGDTDTVAEETGTVAEDTAAAAGDVDTASEDADTVPENADTAAESSTEGSLSTSESVAESESEPAADEPAEAGMYQLDDDKRAELESEYDTGFSSGNDVDPAGEAGIDVPDVDELAEQAEQAAGAASASTAEANDSLGSFEDEVAESTAETSPPEEPTETPDSADEASVDSTESAEPDTAAEESTETDPDESVDAAVDIDLEETVIEVMAELDDGNGVDRAGLVAEVIDRHGVGEDEIQGAIADALMGGRCYEPGDDTLKAI